MDENRGVALTTVAAAAVGLVGGVALARWLWGGHSEAPKVPAKRHRTAAQRAMMEGINREQLNRVESMYGAEGMARIRGAFVVVVGVGGVGSHAATALLRAGVGRIRLVDYDQVTVSTLNRHAVATRADVGIGKGEAMRRVFAAIMPDTEVEVEREVFSEANASKLLSGNPDFVIDAIDNRVTKAQLIRFCAEHGIRYVSCMGAGARFDPTRVQMSVLSDTKDDPLCRVMRVLLKKLNVDIQTVPVVYSTERNPVKLLELEDDAADNPEDYQLLPQFRVRIMPVVGTVPAVVGQTAAAYALNTISGAVEAPMLPYQALDAKLSKMLFDLNRSEESARYNATRAGRFLSLADVTYIVHEMFHHRCALSGCVDDLTMRRWRHDQPVSMANVVLLTKAMAKKHDLGDSLETLYTSAQIAAVERVLAREAAYSALVQRSFAPPASQ